MKKKINLEMIGIAFLAIVLTLGFSSSIFYGLFQREVIRELEMCAHILEKMDTKSQIETETYNADFDNLRISIIGADGTVTYDSNAEIGFLNNHGSRPEVKEAFKKGEGTAIRRSETLDKTVFYYATKLHDGSVLRVAKEADSIVKVLSSVIPILLLVSTLLLLLCLFLAHFLTKSLIRPIEQMAENMEDWNHIVTYQELKPFISTIQEQHEDILKNARMRQDFTANISHELKTPLTSISGYSELIENGMATDGDVLRFAGEIRKNANRLLTLINDIIRLSELDAMDHSGSIRYEAVDLFRLAQNCVDMLQLNAGKHSVHLELKGEPCRLQANKEMIEELLYNLCDNAIRYNKENGTVTITTENRGDALVLSVEDTGIGISEEHKERIFERFYRVDRSRSKQTGGTGLGLGIVKHIAAVHQAPIMLESESGKGTKITVTFKRQLLCIDNEKQKA